MKLFNFYHFQRNTAINTPDIDPITWEAFELKIQLEADKVEKL